MDELSNTPFKNGLESTYKKSIQGLRLLPWIKSSNLKDFKEKAKESIYASFVEAHARLQRDIEAKLNHVLGPKMRHPMMTFGPQNGPQEAHALTLQLLGDLERMVYMGVYDEGISHLSNTHLTPI